MDAIKSLRKDRVAELKADKERLDGLAREKTHSDKLKARISDMNEDITMKEIKHESLKSEHEALVMTNKKFYDSATKFREMYIKVENLQERQKRLQEELGQAQETVREVTGKYFPFNRQTRINSCQKMAMNNLWNVWPILTSIQHKVDEDFARSKQCYKMRKRHLLHRVEPSAISNKNMANWSPKRRQVPQLFHNKHCSYNLSQ